MAVAGGTRYDYSHLLGEQRQPWPLPQLRNAAVEIHRAYQAAHYDRAAAALPKLLAAADAYDGYTGRAGREIYLARCMVYAVTAKLLTKVGESHMAWLAADRATHAAMAADSLTAQGVAAYQAVCALLEDEQVDQAERVAISSAERLTGHAASDAPDTVSLAGALWLIASVIAARKADRSAAIGRLNTAEQLTGLIGHDANHAWTAFGPTNVRIHRASCFAELGDPYAVLNVATEVDVNALPDGLNGRRSRMHLDLAWAQTQARNDMEAVLHLQQAEKVAPEVLRYDRVARGLVRELLRRARRPRPALGTMATRAGILS